MKSFDYVAREFFSKEEFDFIDPANIRRDLEETTREAYEKFDEAKRKSWAYSRYYVLD